jgi:uncharacterized membrane protein YfcA
VAGIPVGIWLLNHLPAARLMVIFGVLLTAYSIYSLWKPTGLKIHGWDGWRSGTAVGAIGGAVGGFTAFPGSAVVVWTGLRFLPKATVRSIVQPFILALQILSLVINASLHPEVFGAQYWKLLAWTLPAVLPGTMAGVMVYRRISDVDFRRVCFILLGVSGVGLLVKAL